MRCTQGVRGMRGNSLLALNAGESGTVFGIVGNQLAAKRLADMGFVRGARLEMVRPGAPCIVRIDGACVGLGAGHQASIALS